MRGVWFTHYLVHSLQGVVVSADWSGLPTVAEHGGAGHGVDAAELADRKSGTAAQIRWRTPCPLR